jgi:hypothetical protein
MHRFVFMGGQFAARSEPAIASKLKVSAEPTGQLMRSLDGTRLKT